MQRSQICAVFCVTVTLLACAADYGFGKLPIAVPRRLPVESFPAQVGNWRAGPVLPVDPDVQAKLLSAKIWDRTYTDNLGHSLDLTLVTAKDSLDIHNPVICLPDQGWHIDSSSKAVYDGQQVSILNLTQDENQITTVYWFTGYYPPTLSQHPWVTDAAKLRGKLIGKQEGESLLVRIISSSAADTPAILSQFTMSIQPEIKKLIEEGRSSS